MTLPRGFKTRAEQRAQDLRAAIGARNDRPLDLDRLATHVGARLVPADELVPIERLEELERLQAFAFSACTFDIGDGQSLSTTRSTSPGAVRVTSPTSLHI